MPRARQPAPPRLWVPTLIVTGALALGIALAPFGAAGEPELARALQARWRDALTEADALRPRLMSVMREVSHLEWASAQNDDDAFMVYRPSDWEARGRAELRRLRDEVQACVRQAEALDATTRALLDRARDLVEPTALGDDERTRAALELLDRALVPQQTFSVWLNNLQGWRNIARQAQIKMLAFEKALEAEVAAERRKAALESGPRQDSQLTRPSKDESPANPRRCGAHALEPRRGLEPLTCALRMRCSAN